jgi:hypothetical protein
MGKRGKVGVHYKPGIWSFLVLNADSTSPFGTVTAIQVTAESSSTGLDTEFWTPTILAQTNRRIAIKLNAKAIMILSTASGTDSPTGDISVVLTKSDGTTDTLTVTNLYYLNDP